MIKLSQIQNNKCKPDTKQSKMKIKFIGRIYLLIAPEIKVIMRKLPQITRKEVGMGTDNLPDL
jgi:hypothetical protein